jgi:hypothetical protein
MSVPVTLNGVVYQIPVQGDQKWAPPLTRYLVALASSTLQPTGGNFTLTANANFGASFGLLAAYFSSRGTAATAGLLRLAKTDTIDWRDNAGTGNNILSTDSSDNLVYNGVIVPTGLAALADGKIWIGSAGNLPVAQTLTGDVTVSNAGLTAIGALKIHNSMISNSAAIAYTKLNLTGSVVNNDIYASAGIAYSKLALSNSIVNGDIATTAAIAYSKLAALTASIVPVTDASGIITSSAVTATTLGFLDATSSIQSQLNAKFPTASFTDAAVTGKLLTGYVSGAGTLAATNTILEGFNILNGNDLLKLPLAGGTLTGDLTLANAHAIIFKETTGNGTDSVTLRAPDSVTTSYTLQLPPVLGAAGSVPTDVAGNGILTMVVPSGSGTVNAGVAGRLALYPASASTIDDQYTQNTKTIDLTIATQATRSANLAISIPNPGDAVAAASVVLTEGATTINGAITLGSDMAMGTHKLTGLAAGTSNGDSVRYEQVVGAYLPIGGGTLTGNLVFNPTTDGIKGTTTNDSAASGNVGEYIGSSVGAQNSAGSGRYFDVTSISLTAGDWDVRGAVEFMRNGATFSLVNLEWGMSTTSGNSATDLITGLNYLYQDTTLIPTSFSDYGVSLPTWRLSLSSTTTVYLKAYYATFSSGTPQASGALSVRRIR